MELSLSIGPTSKDNFGSTKASKNCANGIQKEMLFNFLGQ
jgi:hypothetical protein